MNTYTIRTLALNASRRASIRSFHSTRPAFVKVGDAIPDLNVLAEGSPGNKINLAEEVKRGKALIIGVPAAFSMWQSSSPRRLRRLLRISLTSTGGSTIQRIEC